MILVGLIIFNYSAPGKIIEKIVTRSLPTVKTITIKGTYEQPDKAPGSWALILQEKPTGNYEIIKEDLPEGMKVTAIETKKKVDWLQVFRAGVKVDQSGNVQPVITGNINIYKGVELGIGTDGRTAGAVAGYRYRNIFAGIYYGTGNSAGITLQAKIF